MKIEAFWRQVVDKIMVVWWVVGALMLSLGHMVSLWKHIRRGWDAFSSLLVLR